MNRGETEAVHHGSVLWCCLLPSSHSSFSMVEERDCVHQAVWEGGRSEEAGGGVARFPHLLNISLWGNMLTLLMISMKDKHQETRHWGLGSSWALQQGDSPPTASLAERRHVFIERRAFYVWGKERDEQEISNRKVRGRRRDPLPREGTSCGTMPGNLELALLRDMKSFLKKRHQWMCLKTPGKVLLLWSLFGHMLPKALWFSEWK